ncbi:peptidylprolyl isomerase [Brevibacillus laterosporus]|uniref:peptidylprolyl isomerase n=1 Tax=Brevibacillus laterosporus TaxID=1465 RepID=UPI0018CD875E|nr:peptidylprolyl isomerase [Brevibacillus laterosporus]MBG9799035.1 foldase [Brevibacillus laterosporus]MCR8938600.1 peptidylprolyl isomerase [Brevibacillus laterosporus]MCZ0841240.1 peptidylprolyl isomerase [Brevibacillus laterosporus]MCZ0845188.1 peptidylprolyl isomerase [Brevibacillus laterosporus]MED1911811.1 peptidylprolyl isomerase [Brevibacillus laterosporus]
MKKTTFTKGKRVLALLSTTALTLAILSGCGTTNKAETAQPAKPGAEQPADTEDTLAQFPPVKLPFTVDPNASIFEYQGGKLTGQEFEDFLRALGFMNPPQAYAIGVSTQEMIDNYARQYLATKLKAEKADETIKKTAATEADKSFESLKGQYIQVLGSEDKFNQLMKNHNITKEAIVKQLASINASVKVMESEVKDADLKKEYDTADKSAYTTASVRHILVKFENRKPEEADKLAKDYLARLKKGEDFATLAKQVSEDEGSKANGGLYANADVNNWVPEFKKAALTQKIGVLSEPAVKTEYGYHIVKVEDRKVKTFDEVKDQLKQQVLEKKFEQYVTKDLDAIITKKSLPEVKAPATPAPTPAPETK